MPLLTFNQRCQYQVNLTIIKENSRMSKKHLRIFLLSIFYKYRKIIKSILFKNTNDLISKMLQNIIDIKHFCSIID